MVLRSLVAALAVIALPSKARALNPPQNIAIDGGPLGQIVFSGGVDGGFYAQSNAPKNTKTYGAALGNALVELQKTTGIVQFTIEIGAYSAQTLGAAPVVNNYFSVSPLFAGYITIAPNDNVSVSAGQLNPLVGYEGAQDWLNTGEFFSAIAATQPGQGRGVQIALTQGTLSASLSLTDGYYTGVVNYLQGIGSWAPNEQNSLSVYGGGNLGRTGVNALGSGNVLLNNSTLLGAFYTRTQGGLSITPEVQVQYANPNAALGLGGYARNLSAAVFALYQFSGTNYSLGGFVEYATQASNKAATTTADFFGTGPNSSFYGVSIAPAWQKGNLFARADLGLLHAHVTAGGAKPLALQTTMEVGLLF
ncbi:MAG: hypothetical protein POG74_01620 [Acidocella sp.]|nr:hypothetical protein [Acidocella sp.]